MIRTLCFVLAVSSVAADCYGHGGPGWSNNRLNEQSANRNNGNRLFDSQNNNRGGYNVGDENANAFNPNNNNAQTGSMFANEFNVDQYGMVYLEGEHVPLEFTNQHGCGGAENIGEGHKLNCNLVLQMACNTIPAVKNEDPSVYTEIKDGRNTNTPNAPNANANLNQIEATKNANDNARRGRHESENWYHDCSRRARNGGLFTADQNLNGNQATKTRQNPNGNRRGLECPEERDYYPYWGPSMWSDIAIMTDTVTNCQPPTADTKSWNYPGESQNVKDKCHCIATNPAANTPNNAQFAALTETACNAANGQWKCWNHGIAAPACVQAQWTRPNSLGNTVTGKPVSYDWKVPKLTELSKMYETNNDQVAKCVVRLRYNISTDDYDPYTTDASSNQDNNAGVQSPVQNNPTVDVGANAQGLKLALNTAQTGRTFQDRTHSFYIAKNTIPESVAGTKTLHSLGTRGKRCNIVQCYPAVEYDFQTNGDDENPCVEVGEYIHIQHKGSNTHNNGNPAGDGQAGDAGEGTGGTDRQNYIPTLNGEVNYPIPRGNDVPAEVRAKSFLDMTEDKPNFRCYRNVNLDSATLPYYAPPALEEISQDDCAVYLATSGREKSLQELQTKNQITDPLLNNAPASLKSGIWIKAEVPGNYGLMNSRNNNFSNRSQKRTIRVVNPGQKGGCAAGKPDLRNREVFQKKD